MQSLDDRLRALAEALDDPRPAPKATIERRAPPSRPGLRGPCRLGRRRRRHVCGAQSRRRCRRRGDRDPSPDDGDDDSDHRLDAARAHDVVVDPPSDHDVAPGFGHG